MIGRKTRYGYCQCYDCIGNSKGKIQLAKRIEKRREERLWRKDNEI